MRKATMVILPDVGRTYHESKDGPDDAYEDGGKDFCWVKEIRCLVHAAQFLQVHVTWHDGVKESITYCGPFLIEWAEDSLDG